MAILLYMKATLILRISNLQKGWVIYDQVLYENIQMKYDLFKDQLMVAPKGLSGIAIGLFSPRISDFH